MRLTAALSTLCALTALAQNTTAPNPPTLTYLYTLNCTLADAITIGPGPRGSRVAIPITGGTFSGPKLNGTTRNIHFPAAVPLMRIPQARS
jgi:hypothetical protein